MKDYRRLTELELFCDGIGILTLRRAGVDPARLVSTYQKMTRHEREHFPPGPRVDYYPPLADRKKFAAAVMAWAARQDPGVNEK